MRTLAAIIAYHVGWGAYWFASAARHPDHAPACHHNASMHAMAVMVAEALDA
jgi:hypothetical protein